MTANNFLQSEEWKAFQEKNGRISIRLSGGAMGFVHELPVVGNYLYFPRWPDEDTPNREIDIQNELRSLAFQYKLGWVRIEPRTEILLNLWQEIFGKKIVKAPHDMQPRENFIIDITKDETQLLAEMKPKVRYNIRLAEKKGIRIFSTRDNKYQTAFLALIESTARRQHILPHPHEYYKNFFSVFSLEKCELWIAEYQEIVLAANLVVYAGDTATYLHGGTNDKYRELMAPVFLQWAQICEAKKRGCTKYDFGGVKTGGNHESGIMNQEKSNWAGITRFKIGFSPTTPTTLYPGSYDIVLDAKKYWLYNRLRYLQMGLGAFRKFLRRV